VLNLDNIQQFTAINVLSDPGHIGGPVVIPNAVKVMPVFTLGDGKVVRNVLGGIVGSFTTASATVAEAIRAAIVGSASFAPFMAQIAPTVNFTRIDIQDIRQASLPVFSSTGAASPGTSTGTELPDEVALVLTLRTGGIGAQNRGRLYSMGWATTALGAGNTANTAATTALTSWSAALSAGFAAGGLQWGLMKPARAQYTGATGTVHPARTASIIPLTQGVIRDNHWDSQRRRGLK